VTQNMRLVRRLLNRPSFPIMAWYSSRLPSVSGWLPYRHYSPCRRSDRLSSKGQYRSDKPIAFPVSDNDVLDRASVFFRWASDTPHWNRRTNLALICHLDGG
jgi:hypothetical protein